MSLRLLLFVCWYFASSGVKSWSLKKKKKVLDGFIITMNAYDNPSGIVGVIQYYWGCYFCTCMLGVV